jgi:hypothetical protein
MTTPEQKMYSDSGPALDAAPLSRFLKNPMLTGLAYTLCRLLAAFVCLMSVSEALGVSLLCLRAGPCAETSIPAFSAESEWRAASQDEGAEPSTPMPDGREEREEREEREGEGDDQDDDIDGSRHAAWASSAQPAIASARAGFPRARMESAPDKSHHSLDPKPPRRS